MATKELVRDKYTYVGTISDASGSLGAGISPEEVQAYGYESWLSRPRWSGIPVQEEEAHEEPFAYGARDLEDVVLLRTVKGRPRSAYPVFRFVETGLASGSTFSFLEAVRVGISGFYETTVAAPIVEIVYRKRKYVEALLGDKGKRLLQKVIVLVEDTSLKQHWPLSHIEVTLVRDSEVQDWQYVLLLLFFNSDFDTADRCLHDFYGKLDLLAGRLDDKEQDILRRMLFFDVATTI